MGHSKPRLLDPYPSLYLGLICDPIELPDLGEFDVSIQRSVVSCQLGFDR